MLPQKYRDLKLVPHYRAKKNQHRFEAKNIIGKLWDHLELAKHKFPSKVSNFTIDPEMKFVVSEERWKRCYQEAVTLLPYYNRALKVIIVKKEEKQKEKGSS